MKGVMYAAIYRHSIRNVFYIGIKTSPNLLKVLIMSKIYLCQYHILIVQIMHVIYVYFDLM